MAAWGDMDDLTPVDGWVTFRSTALEPDGVTDFVVMHLRDQTDGDIYMFSMSVDTATRLAYDLLGDGLGLIHYTTEQD